MLLISLSRALSVMLRHVAKIILTKCCKIKHVYEVHVLRAKQTGKIWCRLTIFMHYTDIAIFVLGHFYSDSPCIACRDY